MMKKWLRLWKTKRMQVGAIRYRKRTRVKILHLSLSVTPPQPPSPTEPTPMTQASPPPSAPPRKRGLNLRRIIYLFVIPCRILILILTQLLRYLRKNN